MSILTVVGVAGFCGCKARQQVFYQVGILCGSVFVSRSSLECVSISGVPMIDSGLCSLCFLCVLYCVYV